MSEILGTLFKYALQAMGVAAVVVILYAALSSSKAQNTITQITQLQTNIQSLYSGSGSFDSVTNTVVISAKLAPSDMIVSATGLTNPWNGTVTVGSAQGTGTFFIEEAGLPQDACAKIATGVVSYLSLQINGDKTYGPTNPLDGGAAATGCNVTAATGNTLKFVFGRA